MITINVIRKWISVRQLFACWRSLGSYVGLEICCSLQMCVEVEPSDSQLVEKAVKAKFKVWMTIVESGWNIWVWLVGVVSRRWVWLVGVGGIYGCGFKEIYRFPHTTYPYSSCICSFYSSIPTFSFKCFKYLTHYSTVLYTMDIIPLYNTGVLNWRYDAIHGARECQRASIFFLAPL